MVCAVRQGDRKAERIFFRHTVFDYMTVCQSDKERIPLLFLVFEIGGTYCLQAYGLLVSSRSLTFLSRTLNYLWVGRCCLLKLNSLWGVEGSGVLCWHWRRASESVSWVFCSQTTCWVFTGRRTNLVTNFPSHWLQRETSIWGLLIVNLLPYSIFFDCL